MNSPISTDTLRLEPFLRKQALRGLGSVFMDDLVKEFLLLSKKEIAALLESSDLGTYVVGRRGYRTRFVFSKSQASGLLPFPFSLTNGVIATLLLPYDMVTTDIDRMCAYLQSFKYKTLRKECTEALRSLPPYLKEHYDWDMEVLENNITQEIGLGRVPGSTCMGGGSIPLPLSFKAHER